MCPDARQRMPRVTRMVQPPPHGSAARAGGGRSSAGVSVVSLRERFVRDGVDRVPRGRAVSLPPIRGWRHDHGRSRAWRAARAHRTEHERADHGAGTDHGEGSHRGPGSGSAVRGATNGGVEWTHGLLRSIRWEGRSPAARQACCAPAPGAPLVVHTRCRARGAQRFRRPLVTADHADAAPSAARSAR